MKSKILIAAASIVAVAIGYLLILNSDLKNQVTKLQEQRTKDLKRVRDSAIVQIDAIISQSKTRIDTILIENTKIKYVPYEKLIYANRTLDSALDIVSEYKYNTRTKKEN